MEEKSIEELEKIGTGEALYEIGIRYYKGKEVEKDYSKALEYFKKANDAGNYKGKYGIAKCYYYGKGVENDNEKAFAIFQELDKNYNDIDSKYYIALMHYHGDGVKVNLEKAYELFYELVNKYNDKLSIPILIEMYYYGRGTERNYVEARKYCEMYEDADTLFFLGEMYFFGRGVEINYQKAKEYYEKSLQLKDKSDDIYYKLYLLYSGNYEIERDEEKTNNYLNKVKQDLLKSIIYLILAIRTKEERNLDAIIRYLSIDRELMRKIEEQLPKQNPSYKYFLRVDYLRNDEYSEVTKSIILMIVFGIIEQRCDYRFADFKNEDDVDNYVEKLF